MMTFDCYNNLLILSVFQISENRIGGVMVSVLVSSVRDREFETRSGQTISHRL
jgi:hypothetical protein